MLVREMYDRALGAVVTSSGSHMHLISVTRRGISRGYYFTTEAVR